MNQFIQLILNSISKFVGRWFTTFFLMFTITLLLMGSINMVAGYALIILLLLVEIIAQLIRIARALETTTE